MNECIAFHGHLCPGLVIGYKAARAALDALKVERAEDEELFAIVETDACGADAIQVLTGCTFGKGNFLLRDLGKHAFTVGSRKSGRAFRTCLKAGAFSPSEERQRLFQKIQAGQASEEEQKAFREGHAQSARTLMQMPVDELLDVREVSGELPPKARMVKSQACAACGEPVREDYLSDEGGRRVCPACKKEK
jgi:formylmethanofuran dehydrogenase subunit E